MKDDSSKGQIWLEKIQEQTFHLSDASFWIIPEYGLRPTRRDLDKGRKTGIATFRGLKQKEGLTTTYWSPASGFLCSATWYLLPSCSWGPFTLLTWSATSSAHPWLHTDGQPPPFLDKLHVLFCEDSHNQAPQWLKKMEIYCLTLIY